MFVNYWWLINLLFLQAGTKPKFADDVSIDELAQLTESYTGADLAGLVRQAALQALKNSIIDNGDNDNSGEILKVQKDHFTQALKSLRPSVSQEVFYLKLLPKLLHHLPCIHDSNSSVIFYLQDKIRYEKIRRIYAPSEQA